MNNTNNKESFGSKFGIIAAAAGSAIGLGNIYRFPCEAGANGGGAFFIVYLAIVLLMGLPLMVSEFIIGRRSGKNPVGAFKKLAPDNKGWATIGYMGVICSFLILAFYCTVAGWTIDAVGKSIINYYHGLDSNTIQQDFDNMMNEKWQPIISEGIFIILTAFIIVKGVKKGIEKYSKILMPILLGILIILGVKSLTLPGAKAGMEFFLKPDFSKITGTVLINALGQAFFSLSLGMGCLITYGSYISKKENLTSTAFMVCISDTLIAILAGIVIFPAAFSFGIKPEAGDSLAFVTLPMLFNKMAGGYFFCLVFFILLTIAALTSSISLLEVAVSFITEELKISRKKSYDLLGNRSIRPLRHSKSEPAFRHHAENIRTKNIRCSRQVHLDYSDDNQRITDRNFPRMENEERTFHGRIYKRWHNKHGIKKNHVFHNKIHCTYFHYDYLHNTVYKIKPKPKNKFYGQIQKVCDLFTQ